MAELEVAASVLAEWPAGFFRILDGHRDESGRFRGEGLQQAFGKLYRDLYGMFIEDEFSFLRGAFERFVRTSWRGIVDGKYRRLSKEKGQNGAITIKEAAERLGMGQSRLRRLANLGIVKAVMTPRPDGRTHMTVQETDIDMLKEKIPYMINRNETMGILGISRKQFYALVEYEKILPVVKTGEGGLCEWWFDERQIKQMLEAILVIIPPQNPGISAVSFQKACKSYIGGCNNLVRFLDAIGSGTLVPTGVKGKKVNLSALYFSQESLLDFRRKIEAPKQGDLSIPQVAMKMGVKQEVAYHLVRSQYLPSYTIPGEPGRGKRVSEHSIYDFATKYVGLRHLARQENKLPKVMMKKLSDSGVFPAIGPEVDGCRQVFYSRADLPVAKISLAS